MNHMHVSYIDYSAIAEFTKPAILIIHSIMEATERIQAASNFLLQSPPGEINDVLNGLLHLSFCWEIIVVNVVWSILRRPQYNLGRRSAPRRHSSRTKGI